MKRMSFLYFMTGVVLRPFLGLFAKLRPLNLEHAPVDQGFVLVANHVGWIDPLWIGLAFWPRPVCPMAKSELFEGWLMRFVLRRLGAFPVTRGAPTTAEVKRPLSILENGGIVVVFPGGRREAKMSGVKRGAATIALGASVPIVPVYFCGPGKLALRDLFRRPWATVRVGKPISFAPEVDGSITERRQRIKNAATRIENALGELAEAAEQEGSHA